MKKASAVSPLFKPACRRAIGVAGCVVLVLTGACSSTEVKTAKLPPLPEKVDSVLFGADHDFASDYVRAYTRQNEYSVVDEYMNAASYADGRNHGLVYKAVRTLASDVSKLNSPSFGELRDDYEADIKKFESRYKSFEETASDLGVGKEQFRTGLGVTAAAAVTTVGAVHLLKPRAVSDPLFGTGVRAGYDISKVDNPKFLVAYKDLVAVSLGKDGLGGQYRMDDITYQASLDIKDRRAAANMVLESGLTLGSSVSYDDEAIKGYLKLPF